jgi:hypothetical protein
MWEYVPQTDDGLEYYIGACVFKKQWRHDTLEHIKQLQIPYKHELHGIAPNYINLGIWSKVKPEGFEILK